MITTALTLASPYLIKAGGKIAENIGEDIWNLLKQPFTREETEELFQDSPSQKQLEVLKEALVKKVQDNEIFKKELTEKITESQTNLNQQNINNNGQVDKQINIQTNSGDINF